MSNFDKALNSPYKKVKDVDRELEFIDADEISKRRRLLRENQSKVRSYTVNITRGRGL